MYVFFLKILFAIHFILMSIFIFNFSAFITSSHQNVSSSIGIFVHNLIAKDYLSEDQQDEFLELLKIKIPFDPSESVWPLQIYPRTLAILSQVHNIYYIYIIMYTNSI